MDIQIKNAILDVLKERCAVFNDGMLARYRASAQSRKILALAKNPHQWRGRHTRRRAGGARPPSL